MMPIEGVNFKPDQAKNVAIAGLRRGFLTQYGLKFTVQIGSIDGELVLISFRVLLRITLARLFVSGSSGSPGKILDREWG